MTTHNDILKLIFNEADDRGNEREEVLSALCTAFCAAFDSDPVSEQECEVLDDQAAHLFYVNCYYTAQTPELRAKPRTAIDPEATYMTYMEVNPREVCVPDWARNHRRLLRALAQHERRHDEAMLAYCRREMTTRA